MRTQVAIIGAGPAGLLLGQLLHRSGIDAVVLETRRRQYVEERIRAGVLEQGTVDTLNEAGVGERMRREGLVHHGIDLLFGGRRHRLDLTAMSGGRSITVYGQHEVVKDLIAARIGQGAPLLFEVSEVSLHDIESASPSVRFVHEGVVQTLHCDYIAGCDGFHGICRPAIPAQRQAVFERVYPFAWLGILAEAAPAADALIYASHERGFALFSMRSPKITRLYLQCRPDEDLAEWPDARIWDELHTRLETDDGWHLKEGPILQKSVTPIDAARAPVPGGRRGAHRAAHRRQGHESGGGRRARAGAGADGALSPERCHRAGRLFGMLPAAHLARGAFLVVDDLDVASLRRPHAVHAEAAARRVGVLDDLAGCGTRVGRELRRFAVCRCAGEGTERRRHRQSFQGGVVVGWDSATRETSGRKPRLREAVYTVCGFGAVSA